MDALMMAAEIKATNKLAASHIFFETNQTIDMFTEEEVKLVVEHWEMLMESRKHHKKWPVVNFDTRIAKWEPKLQKYISNNERVKGDIDQAWKNIRQWEEANGRKMLIK